jgi:hypothetical protein
MNIFEAFAQLDILNEAAADDLRNVATEIAGLEKEINELQDQKRKNAGSLTKETAEIDQLKAELAELKKSYQEFSHTEREYDDDRYWDYDVFVDNKEKKAAVAAQEAALLQKLAELEANYKKLKTEITAEQDKGIADRKVALKAKQDSKNTAIKAIVEEDRVELDKLINEINKYSDFKARPDWNKLAYRNDKIYLPLIGETKTYDVDYDDINFDSDDEPFVNTEKIMEYLEEEARDDLGYLADILDIEDNFDAIIPSDVLLEIPDCAWKLLANCDIDTEGEPEIHNYEYHRATYWEPAYDDIDYDKTWKWNAVFYLVKEL